MQNIVSPYIEEIVNGVARYQNSNEMNMDLNSMMSSAMAKGAEFLNLPSMQQLKNIDWSDIRGALTVIGTTLIIILFSCLVMYIFKAIGLYTIMKKDGIKYAWTAFIPYASLYALGKTVGKTKLYGIEIENPEFVLPIILIANMLPFMCALSSIIFVLAFFGLIYRLYQKKTPNFAVVLTILSILLPILIPFFIFAIRNK